MKEFIIAANEEKKTICTKIEDEAEKLTGSAARFYSLFFNDSIFVFVIVCTSFHHAELKS